MIITILMYLAQYSAPGKFMPVASSIITYFIAVTYAGDEGGWTYVVVRKM